MIAYIIWASLGGLLAIMGIITIFLNKPASFWANFKSIEPKAYKEYNLRVGLIWIGFGIYLALIGLPFLLMEDNKLAFLIPILGIVIGVIAVMVIYSKIELKFKQK